jgi:hypothetical protein
VVEGANGNVRERRELAHAIRRFRGNVRRHARMIDPDVWLESSKARPSRTRSRTDARRCAGFRVRVDRDIEHRCLTRIIPQRALPMRQARVFAYGTIVLLAAMATVHAQWITLSTPGLPRLPDGKPDLTAAPTRTADGKIDLSGVWKNAGGDRYYNNVTSDLHVSDVAPAAHALFIKRQLEFMKDGMDAQCLPLGPAYLTAQYREFRIVQTPTLIVFAYSDGMHREIFLDGRSLEPKPNPSWMGYAVGRWEGDVLVVESNGYTDRSWLDGGGHPHTDDLHITERYTRRNIGHMDVQITMTDPTLYAKPITVTTPVNLLADTEMLEAVCENGRATQRRMALVKPAVPVHVPATTLSRYVGTYDTESSGRKHVVEISREETDLWLDYDGTGKELLIAVSPTQFIWDGAHVDFSPGREGSMRLRIVLVEGEERGVKRR